VSREPTEASLRAVRDTDAAGLIALIAACYAEYPGVVLDVDREAPELHAMASFAAAHGGRFWVAETEAAVVGCVGVFPAPEQRHELRKLYVARAARRRGLGRRLCGLAESAAREDGARAVELWSDTRFTDAHRLYRNLGFRETGGRRDLHDLSHSTEIHFVKRLDELAAAVRS